jgi:hypothetical protein
MKIKFLNHASFLIQKDNINLICDPYLHGSAFNNGWSLIVEGNHDLNNITHIYFSHEHPDHFSVPFLKNINESKRSNITVIFQDTFDKRVINFCKKIGYKILECSDEKRYKLCDNFFVTIGKIPIYDSWILCEVDGLKLLNVNDCPIDESDAKRIFKKIGDCDILFTQFSYACWLENKSKRVSEANKQLKKIKIQDEVFDPKFIVPFASFVYFSHEENFFMNDSINRPEDVNNFILEKCKGYPIVFQLNEEWDGILKKDNSSSLAFWKEKYSNILPKKNIIVTNPIKNFLDLKLKADFYKKKLIKDNNIFLVYIFSIFLFRSVNFFLIDLNVFCKFSWFTGLKKIKAIDKNYISLNSDNLAFIFEHNYGLDTLFVNARFLSSEFLTLKMIKLFLLGSLNNIGIYLKFRDIHKFLNFRVLKRGFLSLFFN